MTKKLNDALQLQNQLGQLVHQERELLNKILDLIILAESNRSYLELGHASLFAWLTVHFKYSESAAKRRIDAARLKKSVPALNEKIERGLVNLSTVSKAQSAIRAEESRTKTRMSEAEKASVVEKIEGKTAFETEKILMDAFPEAQIFLKEKERVVSPTEMSLTIVMTLAEYEVFQRAKELLSHSIPAGSAGKIVAALSVEFVKRNDPLKKQPRSKKSEQAADEGARRIFAMGEMLPPFSEKVTEADTAPAFSHEKSRHIPNPIRRTVFVRDHGTCQFRDPLSNKICGSRYQIEVDHIQPWALGGEHSIGNLQCLCAQHNRYRAARTFGVQKKQV